MSKSWERYAECPTCGAAAGQPCSDIRAASPLRRAIRYGVQHGAAPAIKHPHAGRQENP